MASTRNPWNRSSRCIFNFRLMLIFLLLSVIHLVEAWLEETVIELKNPHISTYSILNKREHFRSAILAGMWLFSAMAAAYHVHALWLMPALLVNRRIFFDYPLIIIRDRPRYKYEGNDWWTVNFFKRVFTTNGRLVELALELVITGGCIYKFLS